MEERGACPRQALDDARLDPHGPEHPGRGPHDKAWELYATLPWLALPTELRDLARSAFVFALSICQMPSPEGSLGALLRRAFPPGSLRSEESVLFESLTIAARAMRCSRFDFDDGSGERALELAPLFFGGITWLEDATLRRASRLVFCQSMADSCASRAYFDARAWDPPSAEGMEAFARALRLCHASAWPGADPLRAIGKQKLGEGAVWEWPAAHAARERLAEGERRAIGTACPPTTEERRGKKGSAGRL